MISVTINASGFDTLARSLRNAESVAERELAQAVDSVLDEAREAAASYPPELPNQRYIRTGDLGRGWTGGTPLTSRSGGTVTTRLQNLVPYSGEVQDENEQQPIFQGRWDTTAQILRDVQPVADAEANRAAARIARAIEGGT